MNSRSYKIVDVFSHRPMLGNPVAVILQSEGLDMDTMQSIARFTNLSETTFVVPPKNPEADYALRIFTPMSELPFAGHPTLGTAFAVRQAGLVDASKTNLIQESAVGLVSIEITNSDLGEIFSFCLPPATITRLSLNDQAELEAIIDCEIVKNAPASIINVGVVWIVAQIHSVDALLALRPDHVRSAAFEQRLEASGGVTLFARYGGTDKAIEVRSFAASCGVAEDPVCGSGNGSVAVYMKHYGLLPPGGEIYRAGQGQCVGRDGEIFASIKDEKILIGGHCVGVMDGVLRL
jgi:PhzF family phenazine biosynthesis protein